ncbi:hypothetical protein PRIPAC_86045 [Pristionchus pacificus]|nr:hypothetical protein PRIPAC_86045 [Pristionchus pacificus]
MSNVILKIGEEKLHVSKEYLSIHSPVFKTMFFGEFAEKGKGEVELKGVVYEEFLDLLNLIYFKMLKITDRTVVHILKLADRFQMKDVIKLGTTYLIESKGIDIMTKLLVAGHYNLSDVKDHCLRSFNNATELLKLVQAFPECDKFSSEMKVALFDRLKKLKLQ